MSLVLVAVGIPVTRSCCSLAAATTRAQQRHGADTILPANGGITSAYQIWYLLCQNSEKRLMNNATMQRPTMATYSPSAVLHALDR